MNIVTAIVRCICKKNNNYVGTRHRAEIIGTFINTKTYTLYFLINDFNHMDEYYQTG